MKILEEKVIANKERLDIHARELKELRDKVNNLEENIGMVNVYKEIIKNTQDTRENSKETHKFITIMIGILSILILILVIVLCINQREFNKYREDSVPKGEIIELLKGLQNTDEIQTQVDNLQNTDEVQTIEEGLQ